MSIGFSLRFFVLRMRATHALAAIPFLLWKYTISVSKQQQQSKGEKKMIWAEIFTIMQKIFWVKEKFTSEVCSLLTLQGIRENTCSYHYSIFHSLVVFSITSQLWINYNTDYILLRFEFILMDLCIFLSKYSVTCITSQRKHFPQV